MKNKVFNWDEIPTGIITALFFIGGTVASFVVDINVLGNPIFMIIIRSVATIFVVYMSILALVLILQMEYILTRKYLKIEDKVL